MKLYHTIFFLRVLTAFIIKPKLARGLLRINQYLSPQ